MKINVDAVIAKLPGLCYGCAKPIYVGDKIVIIEHSDKFMPDTAYHEECWTSRIQVKLPE
jgi:hypothetical protein